jgi:hypothetical protein
MGYTLDVVESAALAAKKAAIAANAAPERDVPLPRPCPVLNGDASSSPARHRRERSRAFYWQKVFAIALNRHLLPQPKYAF